MRRLLICISTIAFSSSGLPNAFGQSKTVSKDEVQKHNQAKDCWMIIEDKVYDLTKTIVEHKELCDKLNIADYCGKDGTEIWAKKEESKRSHKKKSLLILQKSLVGRLEKTTN